MNRTSIRRISVVEQTSTAARAVPDTAQGPQVVSDRAAEDAARDTFTAESRPQADGSLLIDNVAIPRSLDPRAMSDFAGFPRKARRSPLLGRIAVAVVLTLIVVGIVGPRLPPISIVVTNGPVDVPHLPPPQSAVPPPQSAVRNTPSPALTKPVPAQLKLVRQPHDLRSDQPYPLSGWTVSGEGALIVVSGLASGAKLSRGQPAGPNSWQIAPSDLRDAAIIPPLGFAGKMEAMVELRLADGSLADRQNIRLEWSPNASSAVAQIRALSLQIEEITRLLRHGQQLLANGQIAAARLVFQRVAESGEPRAAFALAETYDPLVLEGLGAKGVAPDATVARTWYEKAAALGSTEAHRRLERLTSQNK